MKTSIRRQPNEMQSVLAFTSRRWFTASAPERESQVYDRSVTGPACGFSRKQPWHARSCANYNPQRSKK